MTEEALETASLETDKKLIKYFPGRVVRKDLTKLLKVGHNVPVYVLEYLLGSYCADDDEDVIQEGIQKVKNILSQNYVRPDEAEKIKSKIRETGYYTVIDKITVRLNEKRDIYEASFSNLGIINIEIDSEYVIKYEKLLGGGDLVHDQNGIFNRISIFSFHHFQLEAYSDPKHES